MWCLKTLMSTNELATLRSAANLLGVKFLDHLVLGSTDCEEGRGYVSIVDYLE